MTPEQEASLLRAGNMTIRKKSKRHDYMAARWRGENGKIYRITRRVKDGLYILNDAYGTYPPPGMSMKITVMDLVKKFNLIED